MKKMIFGLLFIMGSSAQARTLSCYDVNTNDKVIRVLDDMGSYEICMKLKSSNECVTIDPDLNTDYQYWYGSFFSFKHILDNKTVRVLVADQKENQRMLGHLVVADELNVDTISLVCEE